MLRLPLGLSILSLLLGNLIVAPAAQITMNHGQKARVDVLVDFDPDIVPATLAISLAPASGNAAIQSDDTILYSHSIGSPGSDSFEVEAENGSGQISTRTVTITFDPDLRFPNPAINVPAAAPVNTYGLVNAFAGLSFTKPVCIVSPPGDTQRLFICEKGGLLKVIPDVTAATPTATTFLDLPDLLGDRSNPDEDMESGFENGLLGLAFHPDYATNGYFYIFYSVDQGSLHQRVSRFSVKGDNPNLADRDSELILLEQFDQAGNHNGGDLHFGPDGYLYISVGDEGDSNDSRNNSQTITKDLFAGILRIDVDKLPGNVPPHAHAAIPDINRFSIPLDNPFVHTADGGTWDGAYNGTVIGNSSAVRTEFYATGLRNPWRMSFDPFTGKLWCGDVGQGAYEEIDLIEKGGNYGWAYREGNHNGHKSGAAPANFDTLYHDEPIYEYDRSTPNFSGRSVTGGLVYRGSSIAELHGKYIFADYSTGHIWTLDPNSGSPPTVERIAGEGGIVGFGSDPSNQDVLLADYNGNRILRLVTTETTGSFPPTLSDTGLFADLTDLSPAPGVHPYSVNLPFWSDHAIKQRWFSIPNGTSQLTWSEDDPWTLPSGMLWVKHFDLELERGNPGTNKRIETRLLVKTDDGAYGVSYRWNEAGTEATLVDDAGEDFDLTIDDGGAMTTQHWRIPSRGECLICHTPQAGHALSFNTRQLNLASNISGFTGNQLSTLHQHGFFTNTPDSPNLLPRHLATNETAYSLEARVRSYLAVNCAYCHKSDGTGGSALWDGRSELTLEQTGLLLGAVNDNGGDLANKFVVPGDINHSVLLSRVATTNGFSRMPAIGSNQLDEDAISLLTDWITTQLPARQSYAQWRLAQFTSDTSPEGEPDNDADLDDFTNEHEFLHGTDPLDPSSLPRITLTPENGLTFKFSLPENRSFRIHSSTDLFTWTPWDIPGNEGLPTPAGLQQFVTPLDGPTRFFSLEVSEN